MQHILILICISEMKRRYNCQSYLILNDIYDYQYFYVTCNNMFKEILCETAVFFLNKPYILYQHIC
jgi:hypothetical protein